MKQRLRHPSIRMRLTLTHAVVLVGTCAALLALNYALLYQSLYTNIHGPSQAEMAAAVHDKAGQLDPAAADGKYLSFQRDLAEIARLRRDTLMHTAGTTAIALAVTPYRSQARAVARVRATMPALAAA